MNEQAPDFDDSTIQRAKRFEGICDEFETQCSGGNRPSIESFLSQADGPDKQPLLVELIAIEMHYRRQNGESVAYAEYQIRFPGLSALRLEETIQRSEHPNFPKTPAADDATIDSQQVSSDRRESKLVKYFGDYELLDVIARGGMGIVYKARQVSLNRIVALKMILAGEFASKEEVDRFYSEAKAAALLDHPGIVPIYEVGEHQGKHFFSMTYVEGSSLASKLNDGPLEPMQAARTMLAVTQAVHYAHEQGVIHRDLKPSNILLDLQGRPRVTDFGLAKRLTEDTGMTVSGQVLGTPSYMPPEQAAGQINTIGPASDVYALGAVLYSLTTGRPPFQSASSIDTLRQVVEKEPVAPRQLNSAIPRDLETIILKCLEKSLPRRYGTAKLLSDELQRFVEGRPIIARPIGRAAKAWRWCRRQPMVASLSAMVSLLIIGSSIATGVAYLREVALRSDLKVSLDKETQALEKATNATVEAQLALQATERAKDVADNAAKLAEEESAKANVARIEKERQAEIAEQEKNKARASEATTRRNLYISDAARIDTLIKESNFVRAKTLLGRHIPTSPDEEDLRGFDWYYQWRKVEQQQAKYQFEQPVEVIHLSSDGKTLAVGCQEGRGYLLDTTTGLVSSFVMFLGDKHWESIALLDDKRVIGHGKQGGFKVWDSENKTLLAHKPGAYASRQPAITDYVPTMVSKTANLMICADLSNKLALWDLSTIRPRPIPFLNEGSHPVQNGVSAMEPIFYSNNWKVTGTVPKRTLMEKRLDDSGFDNWDQFFIHTWAERARKEYILPGVSVSLPFFKTPSTNLKHRTGHPVRSMALLNGNKTLLAGGFSGEIQFFDIERVSDVDQWIHAMPRTMSLFQLPIHHLETNTSNTFVAACSDSELALLSTKDWKEEFRLKSNEEEFTCACFLEDETFAIGRSDGFIEIRRVNQKEPINRFFAGGGAIIQIQNDPKRGTVFVSSSDGSIGVFSLVDQPTTLVPQSPQSDQELVWLEALQSIGIYSSYLNSLSIVSPENPHYPSNVSLSIQGKLNDPSQAILVSDGGQAGDVVVVKKQLVHIWNRNSQSMVRQFTNATHTDLQGRTVPLGSNKHPLKSVTLRDEFLIENQVLETANDEQLLAAEIVHGSDNLVMLFESSGLVQLVLLDLRTGQVHCELRIAASSKQKPGRPVLKCLGRDRIFVDRLVIDEKRPSVGLIWNTSDNLPELIESIVGTTKGTGNSSLLSRSVHIPQSLDRFAVCTAEKINVVSRESVQAIQQLHAPDGEQFEIAFMSPDGSWHAVLANEHRVYRWAIFKEESKIWETVLIMTDSKTRMPSANLRQFCFDPTNNTLYSLDDAAKLMRWRVPDGQQLPTFQVPLGRVEGIRRNASGTMASITKRETFGGEQLVQSWFSSDEPLDSSNTSIVTRLTFAVPTAVPEYWIAEHGVFAPSNSRSTNNLPKLTTEGKSFLLGRELFGVASRVLSESAANGTRLFQWQKNSLQVWTYSPSKSDAQKLHYGKRKSILGTGSLTTLPIRIASSLDGKNVALSNEGELIWASDPFREWTKSEITIPPDSRITATRWSRDSTVLGICLSSGDVLLYHTTNRTSTSLNRGHVGAVHDALWLPDNRTLATAGADGKLIIWDLIQKEPRLSLNAHDKGVWTLDFDENSNTLYSGGEDGLIRKWIASSKLGSLQIIDSDAGVSNALIVEKRSLPSNETMHNRTTAKWLLERGISGVGSSFGMQVGAIGKVDLEQIDEFAIHTINCRGQKAFTDTELSRLRGLRELRHLDLADCGVTSRGLTELGALSGLHTLELSGIDLSEFDFNSLENYSNLQVLKLHRCKLNDSHLETIIRLFPGLQELQIGPSTITDRSASKLGLLSRLSLLSLYDSPISDETLSAVGQIRSLEKLHWIGNQLTGTCIDSFFNLKQIKTLSLQGAPITDEWARRLSHWNNLTSIDVAKTKITPIGLKTLLAKSTELQVWASPSIYPDNPQLKTLLSLGGISGYIEVDLENLAAVDAFSSLEQGGKITGLTWPFEKGRGQKDIDLLNQLSGLQRLSIGKEVIPSVHYPLLSQVKSLRHLDLSLEPYKTSDSDSAAVSLLRNLESLTIKHEISRQRLQSMAGLTNLSSFHYLASSPGVAIAEVAKTFPNLRELQFLKTTSQELEKAVPNLQSLEHLSLGSVSAKEDGPILARLTKLTNLKLKYMPPETELASLRAVLPNVKIKKN